MTDQIINRASEEPARRGKIARLPADVREQLNQRLFDGHAAPAILPWLNGLPPVQELLASQFAGEPISPQNLSNWRRGGYQRWLQDQRRLSQIKQFGQYAASLPPASRDRIIAGASTLASARIFEFLRSSASAATSFNDLAKITNAIKPFMEAEQNKAHAKLMNAGTRIKNEEIRVADAKLQHRKFMAST